MIAHPESTPPVLSSHRGSIRIRDSGSGIHDPRPGIQDQGSGIGDASDCRRVQRTSAEGPDLGRVCGRRPIGCARRSSIFSDRPSARRGCSTAIAGTGALGIEALSRGAAHVTFVESDSRAVRLIADNLAPLTGLDRNRYAIIRADFADAARRLDGSFDIVLLDPPYAEQAVERALECRRAACRTGRPTRHRIRETLRRAGSARRVDPASARGGGRQRPCVLRAGRMTMDRGIS